MTSYTINQVKRDLVKVKTIKQALEVKTPRIAQLKKAYGGSKVEAYIKLWLIEFNGVINVTRPLTTYQIDEIAFLIVSEYTALSIADINIIFRRAKMGAYGEFYGTLSIDKILGWFGGYLHERCNLAGEITRQSHERVKYVEEKSERGSNREDMIRYKTQEINKQFTKEQKDKYKNYE